MNNQELQKHVEVIVNMEHILNAERSQRAYLLIEAANLAVCSSSTDIADMEPRQRHDYLAILSGSRDALAEQELLQELAWLYG